MILSNAVNFLAFTFLSALAIRGIYICLNWHGMIFYGIGQKISRLPEWIAKPLGNCIVCMSSIYGILFWIVFVGKFDVAILFYICSIAGINTYFRDDL